MEILVVVDMQNDFISGALGTPEAQAMLPRMVNYLHNVDDDTCLFFTADTHYEEDYFNTVEGQKLPVLHCVQDTWGWDIADSIKAIFGENLAPIMKPTFGSLNLMDYLADVMVGEDDVVIKFCGLCTDICVISNAMMAKAYFPNATIQVLSDLCAGVTPESHENALKAMAMCHIDII